MMLKSSGGCAFRAWGTSIWCEI